MRSPAETWTLLQTHLELGQAVNRPEYFFIECAGEPVRNTLRNRLHDYCEGARRGFLEPLSRKGIPQDPFAWFSSMWSKGTFSNASPVIFLPLMADETERYALHRLNEQRDNLLREMKGALCIVGLAGFFRRAPVEAPDLWSLKARALEFFSFAPTDEVPRSSKLARLSAPPPGPYPYDVLLVAHRYDHAFGREVYRRLTRDGVLCLFDETDAPLSEDPIASMRSRIAMCKRVLLVSSPELHAVEWPLIQSALLGDDEHELRARLVLLIRRPSTLPPALQRIPSLDGRTDDDFERVYPQLCRSLGGTPGEDVRPPQLVEGVLPPLPAAQRGRFDVPLRSLGDRFINHVALLFDVHRALFTERTAPTVLLYGLPGVGKTQIAVEYAHRFSPFYPGGVYWIGPKLDRGALDRLSRAAGVVIPPGLDERLTLATIRGELARRPDSLLVADALASADLEKLAPSGRSVHVLATSRKRMSAATMTALQVNPLSDEDVYRLLTQDRRPQGGDEEREARSLAAELGGLPVTLRVAGSTLRQHLERTYGEHLTALRERTREPQGEHALAFFEEALRSLDPRQRTILSILAMLSEAPLRIDLLRDIAVRAGVPEPEVASAIALLDDSALVEQSDAGLTARPMISTLARRSLPPNEARLATKACDAVVQRWMQLARDDRDMSHILELADVAPHAEALFERAASEERLSTAIDHGISIVSYHLHAGHYRDAERLGRRALALAARNAEVRSLLAFVLLERGALDEALELARAARQLNEASFGANDPIVARDVTLEGAICTELGRYEDALEHLAQARVIVEDNFGREHVSFAAIHLWHARALHRQERLQEALPLAERAAMLTERAVGPSHPHVAECARELSAIVEGMGDHLRAEQLIRRALQIDETTLGRDHPAIAHDLAALGAVLGASYREEEARPLLARAQRIASAELLSEHRLLRTIANLLVAVWGWG